MENPKIAIIGLGYVGLPLAVEFAKHYEVVGFDINQTRVEELRKNQDFTMETTTEQLEEVNVSSIVRLKESGKGLWISNDLMDIKVGLIAGHRFKLVKLKEEDIILIFEHAFIG